MARTNKWSKEELNILKNHTKEVLLSGGTVSQAMREVSTRLNRTTSSCMSKYSSSVRPHLEGKYQEMIENNHKLLTEKIKSHSDGQLADIDASVDSSEVKIEQDNDISIPKELARIQKAINLLTSEYEKERESYLNKIDILKEENLLLKDKLNSLTSSLTNSLNQTLNVLAKQTM